MTVKQIYFMYAALFRVQHGNFRVRPCAFHTATHACMCASLPADTRMLSVRDDES